MPCIISSRANFRSLLSPVQVKVVFLPLNFNLNSTLQATRNVPCQTPILSGAVKRTHYSYLVLYTDWHGLHDSNSSLRSHLNRILRCSGGCLKVISCTRELGHMALGLRPQRHSVVAWSIMQRHSAPPFCFFLLSLSLSLSRTSFAFGTCLTDRQ